MKTHFTSESASLTARAVGDLNRKGRELKAFGGTVQSGGDRAPLTPVRIELLLGELEEFGVEDLAVRLGGRTPLEAEALLRRMLLLGLVYERSPGRYRKA
jgi:hypothetical protein